MENPQKAGIGQEEALTILEACKALIAKFNVGGVMQELTAQEGELLEQFHLVEEAGWVGEAASDDTLRMRVGLLKSDIGMLSYAYLLLVQRGDPAGTLAEIKAYFANRARSKDRAAKAPNN